MEPYEDFSILYWYGYVAACGTISYALIFKEKKERVCALAGFQAMHSAYILCYPVVCLN